MGFSQVPRIVTRWPSPSCSYRRRGNCTWWRRSGGEETAVLRRTVKRPALWEWRTSEESSSFWQPDSCCPCSWPSASSSINPGRTWTSRRWAWDSVNGTINTDGADGHHRTSEDVRGSFIMFFCSSTFSKPDILWLNNTYMMSAVWELVATLDAEQHFQHLFFFKHFSFSDGQTIRWKVKYE